MIAILTFLPFNSIYLSITNVLQAIILGHGVAGTDTDANKTDTDVEDNADSSQKDLVCDIFIKFVTNRNKQLETRRWKNLID